MNTLFHSLANSKFRRRLAAFAIIFAGLILLLALSIVATRALFGSAAGAALLLTLALAPVAVAVAVAFALRQLRHLHPGGDGPSLPQEVAMTSASDAPVEDFSRSLDEALGANHMRDLRAQVDLLCTMATVERMGPMLTQSLRNSGAATLAYQAASSAQIVGQILSADDLATQLRASRIRLNPEALLALQGDLQAISIALGQLGTRLRGDETTVTPLWKLSPTRDEMIANLEPVDQLLIQSTLLLSSVSDLARILATNYSHARIAMTQAFEGDLAEGQGTGSDGDGSEPGYNLPAWKLN